MDTNQLKDLAQRYKDNRKFITNEETAKMALVVPFIKLLGYDPNHPREVRAEFCAEFVQGDGKKYADRMDFAIFDPNETKPRMVIETKPLGTDLASRANQLARYIAQLHDLHFGIITDGCTYLFYSDLENPNQMDKNPFFSFSFDDPKTDWVTVANFLTKFGRDTFNADTLITDAENSRYRQAMVEKLVTALNNPGDDKKFLDWVTADVYKGRRTTEVMERLAGIAKQAVEPVLTRMISDDFLNKLKERMLLHRETVDAKERISVAPRESSESSMVEDVADEKNTGKKIYVVETTEQEIDFYKKIQEICVKGGDRAEDIIYKDTVNYFGVSFQKPSKWFVRFFGGSRRTNITTRVPVSEAKQINENYEIESAPPGFGVSRIYFDSPSQLWALEKLIRRSLEIVKTGKDDESTNLSSEDGSKAA